MVTMPEFRYVIVDVFTHQPLAGNPLAVFTDAVGLTPAVMQALARELNLSETTFVLPAESTGTARVRIFTPRAEIPFAGHPTLGTALVLAERMQVDELTLELPVGHVSVSIEREGDRPARGWFRRPAPTPLEFEETTQLHSALGITQTATPTVLYDNGMKHAVVHVKSEVELDALQPDLSAMARVSVDTVDVFAAQDHRARLRVFAPAHGVPEDPATGSAAAPVLCHLIKYAAFDPGATLSIRQGERMQRPAQLRVRYASTEPTLIEVGGDGVTVGEGVFRLPTQSPQT